MYVVTRTFRDAKGVFIAGTVVEPTDVRTFRSRLADRHIINVDECDIDRWGAFFKNRYGIDLLELVDKAEEAEIEAPVVNEVPATAEEVANDTTGKVVETTTEDVSW